MRENSRSKTVVFLIAVAAIAVIVIVFGGKPVDVNRCFPEGVARWYGVVTKYSNKNAVDPILVLAIIQNESAGDPNAVSSAGAIGLMQVMPMHVSDPESLFDPETNISVGVHLFKQMFNACAGDLDCALGKYNGAGRGSAYARSIIETYHSCLRGGK